MVKDFLTKINGVSETLFFMLYSRAIESQSKNPIIKDEKSVEIVNYLDKVFSKSDSKVHKVLYNRNISRDYIVINSLRTKKFDEYVSSFLLKNPNGIIVNMGCGLDTRFFRINNERGEWYDIDLPEVIDIKKQFLNENNRYHFISSSLHDFNWMKVLFKHKGQPFMFLAEGVFQYFHENDLKSLIFELQKKFSGCEIVFDVTSKHMKKRRNNRLVKGYFKLITGLDDDVKVNFAIRESKDISFWNDGIKFLDEYSYYDTQIDKIRNYKLHKFLESIKKTDWIVHYKLNSNII